MTHQINILIITSNIFRLEEESKQKIKDMLPEASVTVVNNKEVSMEQVEAAEIIFGWPNEEQLKTAKNLRWLHLPSAGAEGYTEKELYCNKDIMLTNSRGVYGFPIAEHVFSMLLSYNRNLQEYAYQKKESKWHRLPVVKDFFGSTVGIIGLGDIGTEVAKRAKAWGAKVLAIKRRITSIPEYVDELYDLEELDQVLQLSDYVILCLPNTSKTSGIITEDKLKLMKRDAFLVNVGRGSLIDQEALIKALQENWIGGAGLDVTEPEPLPQGNPLWELPNVIITPHVSGFSPSTDNRRFAIFYRNLQQYINKGPMENTVDFIEGY